MPHVNPDCPGRPGAETPDSARDADLPMSDPLELEGAEQVADMIDKGYARSGVNGRRLAEALSQALGPCYLLPAIAYANSQEHMDMAGTITLRPSTLALVIEDIVLSLRHHGIRRIVILTTHGGNWILKPTIRDLNFRYPDIRIIHADGPLLSEREKMPRDVHASSGETAGIAAIRPDLVKGRSPDHSPPFGQEWLDYAGMGAITESGRRSLIVVAAWPSEGKGVESPSLTT